MRKTKNLKNFSGLNYITVKNVPIRTIDGDTIIDISLHELERRVSIALLENRVPIHGRELKLIKSALRLSFEDLAALMRTSDKTIKNWVRKRDERLSPGAEALFRLMAAEKLGVKLEAKISDVIAKDKACKIIVSAA